MGTAFHAFVWDNAVFSSARCGVFVGGAGMTEVVNTLAYGNAEDGIHLDRPGGARVFNNTVYGNGGWGLLAGGASNAGILNNIFHENASASVSVAPVDAAVNEGFNLTMGAYAGLEPAESDLFEDPLFADPDGADGVLGGDGAEDDDFHLRPESPAIDAGSAPAEFLGISGSATADGRCDAGPVDLGFHYGASPRVP